MQQIKFILNEKHPEAPAAAVPADFAGADEPAESAAAPAVGDSAVAVSGEGDAGAGHVAQHDAGAAAVVDDSAPKEADSDTLDYLQSQTDKSSGEEIASHHLAMVESGEGTGGAGSSDDTLATLQWPPNPEVPKTSLKRWYGGKKDQY